MNTIDVYIVLFRLESLIRSENVRNYRSVRAGNGMIIRNIITHIVGDGSLASLRAVIILRVK